MIQRMFQKYAVLLSQYIVIKLSFILIDYKYLQSLTNQYWITLNAVGVNLHLYWVNYFFILICFQIEIPPHR